MGTLFISNQVAKMMQTVVPVDRLPILVKQANLGLIQSVLDRVQGRAYADILSSKDVVQIAVAAESALESSGIAASYRAGATFSSTPCGPSANAYRYSREGTSVVLERKASGWSVVRAFRITVWPKQRGRELLTITPMQKRVVLRLAMRAYAITVDEARNALDDLAKAA